MPYLPQSQWSFWHEIVQKYETFWSINSLLFFSNQNILCQSSAEFLLSIILDVKCEKKTLGTTNIFSHLRKKSLIQMVQLCVPEIFILFSTQNNYCCYKYSFCHSYLEITFNFESNFFLEKNQQFCPQCNTHFKVAHMQWGNIHSEVDV